MLERTCQTKAQASYQRFVYHCQSSAVLGHGPDFLHRILLELSNTGNVLSWEASDNESASQCDFPRGYSFLFLTALQDLGTS